MKYELASSTEEDVTQEAIPYYKSHLQYYYYPHTTRFIGRNSIPHFMNYKGEGISTKLKKEIRADYPYLQSGLLESSKAFFDNHFLFVKNLDGEETMPHLVLKEIKADYKEVKKLDKKSTGENRFDKFFQRFFFQRDEQSLATNEDVTRAFALEDRMLEGLDNKNAFIFLRVASERRCRDDTSKQVGREACEGGIVKKYAFEEMFYNIVSFYEYLELCEGSLVRSHNSEEIRSYVGGDSMVIVFSSTTFKYNGAIKRLYSGVDCSKNTKVLFNRDCPVPYEIQGRNSDNMRYLMSLDLPEGDYAINDKKVYKVGSEGDKVEFKDISYDDFIRSAWEQQY